MIEYDNLFNFVKTNDLCSTFKSTAIKTDQIE